MPIRVVKELGSGGFGIVHEVVDENGDHVARKTFQINQAGTISAELALNVKRRFVREVTVQQSLTHPNIVPVIGENLAADPPYFDMPVASSTLEKDIARDKTLGGDFLTALMDITAGLEELHSLDIYHRDLKPKNVLRFDKVGRSGETKPIYAISDFGFVSLRETQVSTVLTQVGMRLGTDYYTAPEITSDLRRGLAPADIYSIGCILHDLVGQNDRIPCSEIREEGQYGGILLNCTRRDPARRFQSVTVLRDALLSIEVNGIPLVPGNAKYFVDLLNGAEPLESENWGKIADYLEDAEINEDVAGVLGQLTITRIDELVVSYPEYARRISGTFARWIRDTNFSFASCDGLANRTAQFIRHQSLEVKADCLLAMLMMGTRHNRWYVEHKYTVLTGPEMDENVAKRLAVEFRVAQREVCRAIEHLESSISFDRSRFHPILVGTLAKIYE